MATPSKQGHRCTPVSTASITSLECLLNLQSVWQAQAMIDRNQPGPQELPKSLSKTPRGLLLSMATSRLPSFRSKFTILTLGLETLDSSRGPRIQDADGLHRCHGEHLRRFKGTWIERTFKA